MFEDLRDALDAFIKSGSSGDSNRLMKEAVVEAKVSLDKMREGVERTEQKLDRERRHLADAERRGQLAAGIGDQETVDIANEYAAKHRERVDILERKLTAQREEVVLTERELGEMKEQLQAARRGIGSDASDDQRDLNEAWREIDRLVEEAGTQSDAPLRREIDRAAREAAVNEQLEQLKKKMGR